MPVPRLLAAAIGLLIPLAMAGSVEASPHRRHPSAHVRTATYKVHPPAKPSHRLRATSGSHHRHVAQAQRHHTTRRS